VRIEERAVKTKVKKKEEIKALNTDREFKVAFGS
jgi:hypothetical protein